MKWYWVKTNTIIKKIFSNYVWDIPVTEKKVYLTFDDGPTPDITHWVLNQLDQYNAKATFFCIGENVQKNPEICQLILQKGHTIGNHTFNHLNGWKTNNRQYLENTRLCQAVLQEIAPVKQKLFRPPYGKIRATQADQLRKEGYRIIMWDVLSADFDHSISAEKCLSNVTKNVKQGSVIVFHDSIKSYKNLEYTLPQFLSFLHKNHFVCEVIR